MSYRQITIQRELLRHVTYPVPCLASGSLQVETDNARLTFARLQQSAEHFKCSGLARPVWTEQAKDFASSDGERNMVGSGECSETFRETFGLNHRITIFLDHAHVFRHDRLALRNAP